MVDYIFFHFLPFSWVGGNLSPESIETILGLGTSPPRGPTSLYFPFGSLSVPGFTNLVILFTSFQANYSMKGTEEKKEEVMGIKNAEKALWFSLGLGTAALTAAVTALVMKILV